MAIVTGIRDPFPQIREGNNPPQNKIKDVALRCLREFAIAAAFAAFSCCFVANFSAVTTIATGLIIQTIFNSCLRFIASRFESCCFEQWLRASIFGLGTMKNVQTVVHELGHASAVHGIVKNTKTTITLFPYKGGVTQSRGGKELTWLGKLMGPKNVHPVISAAGPFLSLSTSALLLGIGLTKMKTAPEMSRMFIVSALIDFLSHILYALSALKTSISNFSHDFVALWQLGGIHPLVSAITIAAVPILMILAQFYVYRT